MDWAFSLDLTHAYVPIHRRSRKYLRFTLKGKIFQFRELAFGLTSSPFVFSSLDECNCDISQEKGQLFYIPISTTGWPETKIVNMLEHRHYLMSLITSLGLIINYEKSELIPTQTFTFIGMEFLTNLNKRVKRIYSFLKHHTTYYTIMNYRDTS